MIFLLRNVTTIKCWVLTSQKNLRFRPTRRQLLESMLSVSMLFGKITSFFSICLLYVFSSYFYFCLRAVKLSWTLSACYRAYTYNYFIVSYWWNMFVMQCNILLEFDWYGLRRWFLRNIFTLSSSIRSRQDRLIVTQIRAHSRLLLRQCQWKCRHK